MNRERIKSEISRWEDLVSQFDAGNTPVNPVDSRKPISRSNAENMAAYWRGKRAIIESRDRQTAPRLVAECTSTIEQLTAEVARLQALVDEKTRTKKTGRES